MSIRAIDGKLRPTKDELMHVRGAELADMFGITVRRVEQLSKEYGIERIRAGVWPLQPFVRAYVGNLRERAESAQRRTDTEMRRELKDRLLAVQVRNAELDFEERVRSVTAVEDVQRTAEREGRRAREAFMRLPSRLALELAAEQDEHAVRLRLEEEVRSTLEDLSKSEDAEDLDADG